MTAFRSSRQLCRIVLALAAIATLGSCAAPAPQAPAPAPVRPVIRPVPAIVPAPAPRDWRDAVQTPGEWQWAMVGGRSTASFGAAGAAPLARLSCNRDAAQIVLSRPSSSAEPQPLAVYTTFGNRQFMAVPLGGELVVALSVRDPLLEQIAFSRGRFALDLTGAPVLYLPSWPELSRVIEDCR
jgi:hypothetical protein